jgi:hypothetical protein
MFVEFTINNEIYKWQVLENPAAAIWFNKFKKICRVPLQTIKPQNQIERNSAQELIIFFQKYKDLIDPNLIDVTQNQTFSIEDLNKCHQIYEYIFNNHLNSIDEQELYNYHMTLHDMQGKQQYVNNNLDIQYFRNFGWGKAEGLLTKPVITDELMCRTIDVKQGWIYMNWSEFGKLPFHYFLDNEPVEQSRFMQAVTPWITSRPAFAIALHSGNQFINEEIEDKYRNWLNSIEYFSTWKQKYGLTIWDNLQEFGVIPVAQPCFDPKKANIFKKNLDLASIKLAISNS